MIPDRFETPEEREAREAAEQERLRELDDLRWVLSKPEGRRHTWRQLSRAGVFQQVFAGEDTHTTAFRDGNRSHGLRLFADIMAVAPERYAEMAEEAAKAARGDAETT